MHNLFGTPTGLSWGLQSGPHLPALPGADVVSSFSVIFDLCDQNYQLCDALGRRHVPTHLEAADVFTVRFMFFSPVLVDLVKLGAAMNTVLEECDGRSAFASFLEQSDSYAMPMLQRTMAGLVAVPYLFGGAMADAFVQAEPLEAALIDDIRLPHHQVMVLFEQAFALPDVPDAQRGPTVPVGPAPRTRADALVHGEHPVLAQMVEAGGGALRGVVLCSDGAGHLADEVCWLVSVPNPEEPGGPGSHYVVWGSIRRSDLGPVVHRLAAAVCWAGWSAPPAADVGALYGMRRTGRFRRIARNADALGVHTIKVVPSRNRARGTGTGPSPRAHLRRGHWRRVRVAARDGDVIVGDIHGREGVDWNYQGRWIGPTVVGTGNPGATPVYRVAGVRARGGEATGLVASGPVRAPDTPAQS